jgi:hypothetical protein
MASYNQIMLSSMLFSSVYLCAQSLKVMNAYRTNRHYNNEQMMSIYFTGCTFGMSLTTFLYCTIQIINYKSNL